MYECIVALWLRTGRWSVHRCCCRLRRLHLNLVNGREPHDRCRLRRPHWLNDLHWAKDAVAGFVPVTATVAAWVLVVVVAETAEQVELSAHRFRSLGLFWHESVAGDGAVEE